MASEEYRVNYSEITKIYRNERKDSLTEISPDFYVKARLYIREMISEEERNSHNSDMAAAAKSQINETTKLLKHIWEFRTRKLLLLAVSQRSQQEVELRGLADEERQLLDMAISIVRSHEKFSLEGTNSNNDRKVETVSAPEIMTVEPEAVNDVPEKSAHEPAEMNRVENNREGIRMVLLRFVKDAPDFSTEFGEFRLKKGDVANIPEQYAKILTSRKVALEIVSSAD